MNRKKTENIIIIGGGLSGLTLAYLLSKKNNTATVVEASSRLGGRIQTVKGNLETPMELGATWFSDIHPNLLGLIDELGLQKYPQFSKGKSFFQTKSFEPPQEFFVSEAERPSYRLVGGTQLLIDTLAQNISKENIKLSTRIVSITEIENELLVETSKGEKLKASVVILCLPPQLVMSQINFSPALPENIALILPTVHTWMSGSIKFVLEYKKPFWRANGCSGMLYSHTGIVAEMYDHSNYQENKFSFTGFLNSTAFSYSQEVRKELVLRQLAELFGTDILNPISYTDKIWTDEFILGGNQIIQRPHQNNGHILLQKSYMNNRLFFSGTETATEFSGYMEGAVHAAIKIADKF
jgi:monoamine oxidase